MIERIKVKDQEIKKSNDQLYRQKGSEEDIKQELESHIATLEQKVKNLNFCVDHCTKGNQEKKKTVELLKKQNAELK